MFAPRLMSSQVLPIATCILPKVRYSIDAVGSVRARLQIGTEVGWSALVGQMPSVPAFEAPRVLVCGHQSCRFMAEESWDLIA